MVFPMAWKVRVHLIWVPIQHMQSLMCDYRLNIGPLEGLTLRRLSSQSPVPSHSLLTLTPISSIWQHLKLWWLEVKRQFHIDAKVLPLRWAQLTTTVHTARLGREFVFSCFSGWMIYLYVCVTSILACQFAWQVLYIDYGNTEWVCCNRVRQMEPKFIHCPGQAVDCRLPCRPASPNGVWSEEARWVGALWLLNRRPVSLFWPDTRNLGSLPTPLITLEQQYFSQKCSFISVACEIKKGTIDKL